MKRSLLVLMLLALIVTAGCGDDANDVAEVSDGAELPSMAKVEQPLAVDGSSEGYPATPLGVSGAEIYLAHDGNYLYLYLEAEVDGYVSIGFNSPGGGMNGANMILGFLDQENPAYSDEIGHPRSHSEADVDAVEEFFLMQENGQMIMELSYPLVFPEGQGYNLNEILPGEEYELIVALHSSSEDISRQHTARGSIDFSVE